MANFRLSKNANFKITQIKKHKNVGNNWPLVNITGMNASAKIIFLDSEVGFVLNKNVQLKYTENKK